MKSIINNKLRNISNKTFNSKKAIIENSLKNIRTKHGINLNLDEKMIHLVKLNIQFKDI